MLPTPQDINPDFPLPLRGGPGEPLDTERRYFLNFPGVNQYVSIPEVTLTGDFEVVISFLASSPGVRVFGTESSIDGRFFLRVAEDSSTAINAGIFSSSSFSSILTQDNFIAANQFNTVSVKRVGDVMTLTNLSTGVSESGVGFSGIAGKINTIGRHLGNYFEGVLSSLRISDNGTPVRFYPIDDNSTTIRDTIGGNDGTYINGAAADWGRFERSYGGDWQGQGLIVPPWESVNQILEVA